MAVDDAGVGTALPHFDVDAFSAAFDARRRDLGLGLYELADELWEQSADLNAQRMDHPLCGGAVSRMHARGATSCQYGCFMLRWLGRSPEDFLSAGSSTSGKQGCRTPDRTGDSVGICRNCMPRLRLAPPELRLTWVEVAREIDCTPSRLTKLRTARLADMDLAMRVTQWLRRPAADFIHPSGW